MEPARQTRRGHRRHPCPARLPRRSRWSARRYRSPGQYAFEALITVPLVILSRIRRTADPQVVLIQAFVLYLSFLCAAWFKDAALLQAQWGLLRLAIPAGIALLVVILEDAYARPGRRSPLSLVRGPVLGLAFALASQGLFLSGNPDLALPRWILLYGSAMSLLLSCAVGCCFRPRRNSFTVRTRPRTG